MSLFHYTDAAAVMSILQNQKIWMTDIRFLNDSKEYQDGVDFVKNAIERIELQDQQPYIQTAGIYINSLNEVFAQELKKKPKFLCSFSQARDLLSQWRSYGNYAVEFDKVRLAKHLDLVGCVYCEEQKLKDSNEIIAEIYNGFAIGAKAHAIPERGSVEAAKARLVSLCIIFKSNHFREESEVRSSVSKEIPSEEIHYRLKGGIVVPYVPYEFPIDCIKAIHIGPMANQDLAKESMEMFIEQLVAKLRRLGEVKIDVVCSKIPYRLL